MKPNFSRMLELIDETFATRQDPGQIQVTQEQMKKLQNIHPATLSELNNEDGPLIWVLLIPTTRSIMDDFLRGKISETKLLKNTKPPSNRPGIVDQEYDCLYLCSATALPEARKKGDTKKLCLKAIKSISKDHKIKTLFVWPFSKEGEELAKSIANECRMELLIKK
jgi:hypothetical protein